VTRPRVTHSTGRDEQVQDDSICGRSITYYTWVWTMCWFPAWDLPPPQRGVVLLDSYCYRRTGWTFRTVRYATGYLAVHGPWLAACLPRLGVSTPSPHYAPLSTTHHHLPGLPYPDYERRATPATGTVGPYPTGRHGPYRFPRHIYRCPHHLIPFADDCALIPYTTCYTMLPATYRINACCLPPSPQRGWDSPVYAHRTPFPLPGTSHTRADVQPAYRTNLVPVLHRV